jgi:hypothetical protein
MPYGGSGEDARASAGMPPAGHPGLTSPLPTPVDFQRDSGDFRPLLSGLRAGFTCRMFIGAEVQWFVGWSRGEGGVLLGGQGTQAMTGLRCDDDSGATGRDDVPELFEHQRSSV